MTPNNVSKRTGTLAQCLLMNERALIEKLPPERVLATADTTCAPRPRFSAARLGRSDRRVCACNDAAAAAPDQTDASLLCDLRPDSSALLYRKTRIAKRCLSRVFAQQQVSREQTMLLVSAQFGPAGINRYRNVGLFRNIQLESRIVV